MTGERQRYQSYLLRLWQTRDGEKQVWRASLESPGTGQRHGFASLEELFSFLQVQVNQVGSQDERDLGLELRDIGSGGGGRSGS